MPDTTASERGKKTCVTRSDRSRRRARATLIAAVAVTALAGCGEGVPAIDTSTAEAELARVAANGNGQLDGCSIDDADLLLDQILADIDDDLVDAALTGDTTAAVTSEGGPTVSCERREATTGGSVAIQLSDAPGDGLIDPDTAPAELDIAAQWAGIATDYAGRFGDAPPAIATDELQDTRGGVLYEICLTDAGDPERDRCELAWFGNDLVVSIVVGGPGADAVDLGDAVDPFRRRLQLIVDGFAAD